jgi:hypothetical protein
VTVTMLCPLDTGMLPRLPRGMWPGSPDAPGVISMIKKIAGDLHFWIPCAVLVLGIALLVLLH